MEYNKLVRDNIPDIIRAQGETPVVRTLDDEEYRLCLVKKLREETEEFCESGELEELADILEVVFALAKAQGRTVDELMDAYRRKHEARGGFDKRVFLMAKQEAAAESVDVYARCPRLENDRFLLRLLEEGDADDLLRVYSDKLAVPFFNDDNCSSGFYMTELEHIQGAIRYWLWEYERRGFVRMTIVDKRTGEAVGTIELFNRQAQDDFNDCGLLRLDLRSDYEREDAISSILSLIVPPAYDLFACSMVATKAVPAATERIAALTRMGFARSEAYVVGHDGRRYGDYYVLYR